MMATRADHVDGIWNASVLPYTVCTDSREAAVIQKLLYSVTSAQRECRALLVYDIAGIINPTHGTSYCREGDYSAENEVRCHCPENGKQTIRDISEQRQGNRLQRTTIIVPSRQHPLLCMVIRMSPSMVERMTIHYTVVSIAIISLKGSDVVVVSIVVLFSSSLHQRTEDTADRW